MERFSVAVTDVPDARDVALVERGLDAYNSAWCTTPRPRPLCVFVRDPSGGAVGGATGYTDRDWLYLDCFWLPETVRHGGWGGRVLAAAEDEARRRGCRGARLFTYSFQAQGFYEKHGYVVWGVLEGYPPGERQIWLSKALAG